MIIVDCSLALDLLLRPSTVGELDTRRVWCAPALLDVEIVAGIRGLLLGGELDAPAAQRALADYADLGIRLWSMETTMQHRMLALDHNITAYDAAYVVLAESLGGALATHDRWLAAAAADLVEVLEV